MTKSDHTPAGWPERLLPLRAEWSMAGRTLIMSGGGEALRPLVSSPPPEWWEQAAPLIVRAVNAHDELVASLESALAHLDVVVRNRPQNDLAPTNISIGVAIEKARAVLKRATEG